MSLDKKPTELVTSELGQNTQSDVEPRQGNLEELTHEHCVADVVVRTDVLARVRDSVDYPRGESELW